MRSSRIMLGLAAVLGLAACGEESPVGLEDLLPGGGIHTAEAIIDASSFIEWDSVRTGFTRTREADFIIAARGYEGALDVNSILRFNAPVRAITYQDSLNQIVVDSLPQRVDGRLVLNVARDRVFGVGEEENITFSLYDVAEEWDSGSANWTMRIDSGGVSLPWTDEGGTSSRLIDTATWEPGESTLTFELDSVALALLADSASRHRGYLLKAETDGALVEFRSAMLHFNVDLKALPDSVLPDSVSLSLKTFLPSRSTDREGVAEAPLHIGGVPSARSFIRVREGLDTLEVPCPDGPSGCTIRLSDAVINYASIEFQTLDAAPGYNLADTISIEPRIVLPFDGVPLSRAPLGVQLANPVRIPAAAATGPGHRVEVPVSMLISALTSRDESVRADAPRTIALVGTPEGSRFAVVALGSNASSPDLAPRLRLIYSVTKEVQVQ